MDILSPSDFLFPLAQLSATPEEQILLSIDRLRRIYSKNDDLSAGAIRHISSDAFRLVNFRSNHGKIIKEEVVIDSGYASAEEECTIGEGEDAAEAFRLIRNDAYERDFAIRWLTGFIGRASTWAYSDESLSENDIERREALIELAAAVLTNCAGSDEEEDEALTREFRFTLQPSGKNFTVVLNDLIAPEDHSSVGLQSWASSIYFAKMLCDEPSKYGLIDSKHLRVLELGAGTGLLSLTAANILSSSCDIIATDYHFNVLANLQRNVDLNFPRVSRPPTAVRALDWQCPSYEAPLDVPFNVILAADVVYEPNHPEWIKSCVEHLLERPSDECPDGGVFWMVVAVRNTGRHEGLASSVLKTFPMVSEGAKLSSAHLSLRTAYTLDVERSSGVGRADESGHRLFKICWA